MGDLRTFVLRLAGVVATVCLAMLIVLAVAKAVLPALANITTAFFLSPGVLVLLCAIWFLRRSRGKS